ncbi:hypothetical protein Tco_0535966 [Tanacetum coccineum]
MEIYGEVIPRTDANLKFLRSTTSDDTSSTNEAVNTALDVPAARSKGQASSSTYVDDVMFSFFVNQSNSCHAYHEGEEIFKEDKKKSEFQWAPKNQGNRNGDAPRTIIPVETPANALVVQDGIGFPWLKWPNHDREIVTILSRVLAPNPYVQTIRSLGNLGLLDKYRVKLTASVKVDQRLYNHPTMSEVAGIWVEGNDNITTYKRSIVAGWHSRIPKEGADIRELVDDDDDIAEDEEANKLANPDHYDKVVYAEIPDPNKQPELHQLVLKHMIHGPCGHLNTQCPCIEGEPKKCHWNYPRQFQETTQQADDSYPFYHINVEVCSSIKSVNYVFKYVYKGHDKQVVNVDKEGEQVVNEIKRFHDARYVSPPEAMWRIYCFPLSNIYPFFMSLQVHLPNKQFVTFEEDVVLTDILENEKKEIDVDRLL